MLSMPARTSALLPTCNIIILRDKLFLNVKGSNGGNGVMGFSFSFLRQLVWKNWIGMLA